MIICIYICVCLYIYTLYANQSQIALSDIFCATPLYPLPTAVV